MCKHLHTVGDNYGWSCLDCGEVLAGYGYWGQEEACKHVWEKYDSGYECVYCQKWLDEETWQMCFGDPIGV